MSEFNAKSVKEISDNYPAKACLEDFQNALESVMDSANWGQYNANPIIKTVSVEYVTEKFKDLGFQIRVKETMNNLTRLEIKWN